MLILQRELDESIRIGDDIVVTITAIEGQKVKLGIDAPRHIRVDRSEVRELKNKAE